MENLQNTYEVRAPVGGGAFPSLETKLGIGDFFGMYDGGYAFRRKE